MPGRPRVRFFVCFAFAMLVVVGGTFFWPRNAPPQEHANPPAPVFGAASPWLHVDSPPTVPTDYPGRVVLLWFWRATSIHSLHAVPDVLALERRFADDGLVMIGVHTGRYAGEASSARVRSAAERLKISMPLVIDVDHSIASGYGVRVWPTFVLIGADGGVIGSTFGEGRFDLLANAIEQALADAVEVSRVERRAAVAQTRRGLLAPTMVVASPTAVDARGRVFISDAGRGCVVEATYPDEEGRSTFVREIAGIGGGPMHDPQGLAFDAAAGVLYVAERSAHRVLAVDLVRGETEILAGTGMPGHDRRGGGAGREQALNSPVGLALAPDGSTVFATLAGLHQVWSIDVATGQARAMAGSGRSMPMDGSLDTAAFAQPWGLAISADGTRLYVADSESSSIRVIEGQSVRTLTADDDSALRETAARSTLPQVVLQHPRGAAIRETSAGDAVVVADAMVPGLVTIEGTRSRSILLMTDDSGAEVIEPAGVCAASDGRIFLVDIVGRRVLMFEPDGSAWRPVAIAGLE
ncbi:MAG: redoxin domain-containing protein [Phycisphaeraceae bacterium]|nr:redoxin domain-containing protein [Phycisphaeraceae bacterium]MCW5754540.1 redoxin domain-containing protein [Phycisphaeraceae bacterium]